MSDSVFVEFRLMSSVSSNRCPFITFLSLGNRKKSHGAVFGQKLLHKMWSVCGRIVVVQDPVAIPPFFRSFSFKIASHDPTEIPQSSAISRTINLLLLRRTVLTSNHFLVSQCWRSSRAGIAFNWGSTLFKSTEPLRHLCTTHCIFTVCLLQ